jgi:hypothetical protein
MAYICSRCEADQHSELSLQQVREIAGDVDAGVPRDVHTVTTICEGCSSNTVHVSEPNTHFGDE